MHLLLPPSEAKTSGGRGRPLRTRAVDDTTLGAARTTTLAALAELIADRDAAARALLLPAGAIDSALAANAAVLESATTRALQRYSGVVYDGLGYGELTADEQRIAQQRVIVFSGLFGVVRGGEMIPAYRVPAKAALPGLGVAATWWRPVIDSVLPRMVGGGPVVDLRSSDYAAMWRTSDDRVVRVRVLSPVRGGFGIVSYNSKFAKGRLAAALIRRYVRGDDVQTAADIGSAWDVCGGAGWVATTNGIDVYTH